MKLIAAAFGNKINDRALRLAELRAEAVALDAKLLNGVNGRKDQQRGFEPTSILLTPSTVHIFAFDWLPFTDMSTLESSPVPRAAKAPAVETPGTIVTNAA